MKKSAPLQLSIKSQLNISTFLAKKKLRRPINATNFFHKARYNFIN